MVHEALRASPPSGKNPLCRRALQQKKVEERGSSRLKPFHSHPTGAKENQCVREEEFLALDPGHV